jgi:hypothetical protein
LLFEYGFLRQYPSAKPWISQSNIHQQSHKAQELLQKIFAEIKNNSNISSDLKKSQRNTAKTICRD